MDPKQIHLNKLNFGNCVDSNKCIFFYNEPPVYFTTVFFSSFVSTQRMIGFVWSYSLPRLLT